MCTTCGCGHSGPHMHEVVDAEGNVTLTIHEHEHEHDHHHDHAHGHDHAHDHGPAHSHDAAMPAGRAIAVEEDILGRNNAVAAENRAYFAKKHVLALNLVSSPGSGKTELLTTTLRALTDVPTAVVEGDQETANDAARIRATGVRALQINTGKGCHLDAAMIRRALEALPPEDHSVLFIENVGNLVCPAEFDLGEAAKVAVLSVTEGADKPLKYPDMFRASELVLLNKIDLLPYVPFDADAAEANVLRVNPKAKVIRLSATTGEGLEKWLAWVRAQLVLAGL
ncbi:hydrogenase nickel incorporation protein HypB [Sutterella sp.]|uniref:hydrogenase nickel incorporation protein HypB n=1 Tax=Sutterella sp. TaxID=1981025 RepID=UPI003FD884EB